jgi:hypothetical protein
VRSVVQLTPEVLDNYVLAESQGYSLEDLRGSVPGLVFRSKRGKAEWVLKVTTEQGNVEYCRLGGWPDLDIDQAEQRARKVWRDIHGVPGSGQITVEALLQLYQRHKLAGMKSGASTWRSLSATVKPLSERPLASVTSSDIGDQLDVLRADAPIHANRAHAYVRACFAWAVDLGLTRFNPATLIQAPVPEVKRERAPSLSEIAEIWDAAGRLGYPFGPAIRLLIITGAQREEIAQFSLDQLSRGPDGRMRRTLDWRLADSGELATALVPRLGEVEVQNAFERRPHGSVMLFSGSGKTAASGWSKAKRRLDGLVQADRVARLGPDAEPMPPWRLNDFRRSFEQELTERLHIYPTVIECCLGRTSRLTTELEQAWARSDHMLGEMDEALEKWADLLQTAIRSAPSVIRADER